MTGGAGAGAALGGGGNKTRLGDEARLGDVPKPDRRMRSNGPARPHDRLVRTVCVAVFSVLALLEGIYYILNIGPLTLPDPEQHCLASYALATGQSLDPQIILAVDEGGNEVRCQVISGDESYLGLPGLGNYFVSRIIGPAFFSVSEAVSEERLEQIAGGSSLSGVQTVLDTIDGNHANMYSPIGYIPQAIGMRIGMALDATPYGVWQYGRAVNLLVYIVLCSVSIALVPRMRVLLTALCLIPDNLFCASSLMNNALSFALAALLVAMTIRVLACSKGMSSAAYIGFALVASATVFVKAVYLPLFLPALLMPGLHRNKKGLLLAIAIVVVSFALYFMWSSTCSLRFINPGIDYQRNCEIFFSNLLQMAAWISHEVLLFATYFSDLPVSYLVLAFVIALGMCLYLAQGVVSRRAASRTAEKGAAGKLQVRYIFAALLAALCVVAAVFVFELLVWNDLSQVQPYEEIVGIQGRYYLPLLPLLLFVQTLWREGAVKTGHAVSTARPSKSPRCRGARRAGRHDPVAARALKLSKRLPAA